MEKSLDDTVYSLLSVCFLTYMTIHVKEKWGTILLKIEGLFYMNFNIISTREFCTEYLIKGRKSSFCYMIIIGDI